jgi:2',3'-cyclic-nucleotide 2'-phosphodiesterase / 3'-nucleotidase
LTELELQIYPCYFALTYPEVFLRNLLLYIVVITSILGGCSKETIIPVVVTTDVHGSFFPEEKSVPSLSSASTYIKEQRSKNKNIILLDNGDILQGSMALEYFNIVNTNAPNIVSILMNYLNYDAVSVGNHDVEYGKQVYKKVEKEFQFPWLSANIVDSKSEKSLFKPYAIIERGKRKIAVLGLSTLTTQKALKFNEKEEIEVLDLVKSAQKWIDIIKKEEKPDVIIGLFHEGLDLTIPVAENVPGFDIIFTGHDHQEHNLKLTSSDGSEVLIFGARERGISLVHLEIKLKGIRKNIDGKIVNLENIPPDTDFIKAGEKSMKLVENYSRETVAEIDFEIKTAGDNDKYMEILHNSLLKLTDAQLSITAPVSRDYTAGPGIITQSDLFQLYPFINYPVILKLTGSEITKLLKYSEKLQKDNHPKKRFYNNLSIRYRKKIKLEKNKFYTVAMNSYHASNGGKMLQHGAGIDEDTIAERTVEVIDKNIREYLFR